VKDFNIYEFCREVIRCDKEGQDNVKFRAFAAYLANCQDRLTDKDPQDNAQLKNSLRQEPEVN
jgi:hypothetical protein